MKHIPTQRQNPNGLHQRYRVQKIDKNGSIRATDPSSEYFIMRLDEGGKDPEHIKACRIGVHAYADAIEHKLPELAKDLARDRILQKLSIRKVQALVLSYRNITILSSHAFENSRSRLLPRLTA